MVRNRPSFRVAIVEDETDLLESLCRNLEMEGFDAVGFERGEDFLNRLEETVYDLVIVDWNMPDRDGLSIIRTMRERDIKTPVIMSSARIEADGVADVLRAGANDYMRKPYAIQELVARIENQLCDNKEPQQWDFDRKTQQFSYKNVSIQLRKTEAELLAIFLKNIGTIVTRTQLKKCIPQVNSEKSRTLDVHVSSLRGKLKKVGVDLKSLRGVGYRLNFTD